MHMIDMSNNRANMAYTGDACWHGLGHALQPGATVEEWTTAAGLNWTASMRPSYYLSADGMACDPGSIRAQDFVKSADNFHVVRDDTQQSLGVMTGRYNPVQPKEVMSFFSDFILADDRFTLETAGALKEGKVIWALAKFKDTIKAGGDDHVPYCLLTTSYNGSLATTAQATMIRVVCNNTLTASIYDKSRAATVKVPHSRAWTAEVAKDAHARLETVAKGFEAYQGMADALAGLRMSRGQVEDVFKSLIFKGVDQKDASGKAKSQYDALFNSYLLTAAEGTDINTGWAALNAVTRFVDHDRNTRRSTGGISEADARMASAFYGSGAALKSQAVAILADKAGLDLEALQPA
jgi:phage/plasmid-like protein (TIGR03299 family)